MCKEIFKEIDLEGFLHRNANLMMLSQIYCHEQDPFPKRLILAFPQDKHSANRESYCLALLQGRLT